jgi:predicted nucleic acid-binding protein
MKFVRLAHVGQADYLVTGGRALLALSGKTQFVIEKPASFLHRLGK